MTYASDEFENLEDSVEEEQQQEVPKKGARWYAVQVASGCERRVKMNLEQRIQTLDVE